MFLAFVLSLGVVNADFSFVLGRRPWSSWPTHQEFLCNSSLPCHSSPHHCTQEVLRKSSFPFAFLLVRLYSTSLWSFPLFSSGIRNTSFASSAKLNDLAMSDNIYKCIFLLPQAVFTSTAFPMVVMSILWHLPSMDTRGFQSKKQGKCKREAFIHHRRWWRMFRFC